MHTRPERTCANIGGAILFLGLLAGATAVHAQDAEDLRAAIERHYTAIHAGDIPAVIEQHVPEMTWFANDGRLIMESGSGEAAERMGTVIEFGEANVYMNHFNAQIYGNVGVATFYLVSVPKEGSENSSGTSRVTAVWVREGGEWKEAHHHESALKSGN